ncbi:dsDNA nuclease domain-containing protein [Motilibacter deserti]|uniref:dsDNA nuclease domain-containing protein n=1 Tax=Motilibacter deserti TaxID=2714956 RepID=UPI002F2B80A0
MHGPGGGGRRSRRGFAYQDVVTLMDCLELCAGTYHSVGWESDEDIHCSDERGSIYRQVKTLEGPGSRHSIASVCRPEVGGNPATSILGRLFSGKRLTIGDRFDLVLNETPLRDLYAFSPEKLAEAPVPQRAIKDVCERLQGLRLPDGFSVAGCLRGFRVIVSSRSIEDLERQAAQRIAPQVEQVTSTGVLLAEVEEVIAQLLEAVARSARASKVEHHNRESFLALLVKVANRVCGDGRAIAAVPQPTLEEKLRPVKLPDAEIRAAQAQLRSFRSARRDAVGERRREFDEIADEVYAACALVMAARRAGRIQDPQTAYLETLKAVTAAGSAQFPAAGNRLLQGALHDVTARCVNRYADS